MNKRIFIGIGIFWLIIILGFIGFKEFTLQTGTEVLLKLRPIDPRDMFRGDYVILNYEISTLDLNSLQTDAQFFNTSDKVYVTLNEVEGYGVASGIYKNVPKEELFIKGTVKDAFNDRIMAEYGIESYFVPEGQGDKIQRQARGDVDIKVAIDKFGNAVIKQILIEGKEVQFE